MSYTTSQINADFRIKVYGMFEGVKVNNLRGVSGLIKMIGQELFEKFIERAYTNAYECTYFHGDKTVCKLRRGLVVTFYSK